MGMTDVLRVVVVLLVVINVGEAGKKNKNKAACSSGTGKLLSSS